MRHETFPFDEIPPGLASSGVMAEALAPAPFSSRTSTRAVAE
jgi:hypothetical protein